MAFPPLTGNELLLVLPLHADGSPGPITLKTTTGAIAGLAVVPAILIDALNAVVPFLPTSEPSTPGLLYLNGGTLCVSQ